MASDEQLQTAANALHHSNAAWYCCCCCVMGWLPVTGRLHPPSAHLGRQAGIDGSRQRLALWVGLKAGGLYFHLLGGGRVVSSTVGNPKTSAAGALIHRQKTKSTLTME